MLVVSPLFAAADAHDDVDSAAAGVHWSLDLRPLLLLKRVDAALVITPGRVAVVPAGRRAAESGRSQQQEKAYNDLQGLIVEARVPPT